MNGLLPLHVLDELDIRVNALRTLARAEGTEIFAPLLVLGTSERVGSNWLSDSLRPVMPQHNEPFRQQLGPDHPLSPVNPFAVDVEQVSKALLGNLGWHWLAEFVLSKYGPVRQLVKETNLFFAAATVLRLFPEAPVVVLSRSPLGVASSFARSNLFARWDYAGRYQQMLSMTKPGPYGRFATVVPDDDPDDLIALTRLVVLNTLLLADALEGREPRHIRYETAVLDRARALGSLGGLIPPNHPGEQSTAAAAGDDLFATTNHKQRLVASLDAGHVAAVQKATVDALSAAVTAVPESVLDQAATWLTGAELYQLDDTAKPKRTRRSEPEASALPEVSYAYCRGLAWRNLLVSNAEFCGLLNSLHAAGVPNTYRGTHLLFTPMPHERGGRIHFDTQRGRWSVSPGFDHHPVYWVTWPGAAAFALSNSARLPTHGELCVLAADSEPSNHNYAVGDAAPVVQSVAPLGIHHPVGNVQVWCGDGPPPLFGQPVEKWLHGAAWNTPATPAEVNRLRSRHLLGSSRGVGIRLVRDLSTPFTGPTIGQVATMLDTWIDGLADRDRSLSDMDSRIAAVLTR